MRFADILGHEEAIRALRDMKDAGRIPHALLLCGAPGIGKMRLARAFISYINCENPQNGDSCGVCASCRRIANGNDPDVHYVFPFAKNASKKLESCSDFRQQWLRMLNEHSYMPPEKWMQLMGAGNSQAIIPASESAAISTVASMSAYAAKYKIFVLWLPEKMHNAMGNKLLKLLEEPFEDTLFICVSNDPGQIMPTIFSRLQRIELKAPPASGIEGALLAAGVCADLAKTYSRLAAGSMQRALDLADSDGETAEFTGMFRNVMRTAYARQVGTLRDMADQFAALGREKNLRFLDYFAHLTRENFIANLKMPLLQAMTPEEEEFSRRFAPFVNVRNVEEIIRQTEAARQDISRNANAKLVWFDFMLRLLILLRK